VLPELFAPPEPLPLPSLRPTPPESSPQALKTSRGAAIPKTIVRYRHEVMMRRMQSPPVFLVKLVKSTIAHNDCRVAPIDA
jgi:hypothetical protein